MAAIEVRGLVKIYGATRAVDGVDLDVESGQVFALLGPNGAGKTTTVEILEGHRTATSGSVSVLGMDPQTESRRYREKIGIVLQETAIERELTVTEALDNYGGVYPHRRPTGELIELVGLQDKARARTKTLSGGQQRRLELALGLVGDPDLLFLDEPTTGFDPSARRQAWAIVANLASLGKTILLTTHYMDEAQYLADRVAIIANGRIIVEGPPSTLHGRDLGSSIVRFKLPEGAQLPAEVMAAAAEVTGYLEFKIPNPTHFLHDLTGWALQNKVTLESLEVKRPSLEDIYLKLTEHAQPAEVAE
jgi:ABC-2 type transport system ATP-binding protein